MNENTRTKSTAGISRFEFLKKTAIAGLGVVGLNAITNRTENVSAAIGDFWTVVDPTLDNALSIAINSAPSGTHLLLKAGTYTQTLPISITDKNLYIHGSGKDITYINFQGITQGNAISVSFSNEGFHITLEKFSITINSANSKTAIQVSAAIVGTYSSVAEIYDIEFRGSTNQNYWATCIKFDYMQNSIVRGCEFFGYTFNAAIRLGTFIQFNNCYNCVIDSCFGWSANIGINLTRSGVKTTEGIVITNCLLGGCEYGVYSVGASGYLNASIHVANCIIDWTYTTCVTALYTLAMHIENCWLSPENEIGNAGIVIDITSSRFFIEHNYGETRLYSSGPNFMYIKGTDGSITGNISVNFDTHIWIDGGARVQIIGNRGYNTGSGAYGIYLAAGSSKCIAMGNNMKAAITNSGTNNVVVNNIVG